MKNFFKNFLIFFPFFALKTLDVFRRLLFAGEKLVKAYKNIYNFCEIL